MANGSPFLVRTFCATYNHESYITDALQGFVMQETSFPVVYTIVDDASTDKTAEVLRRFVNEHFDVGSDTRGYDKDTDYGHVTFARHKTNKNCYFAFIYLKENHYSQKKSKAPYLTEWLDTKYIALCEGDDYWTDPLKLQKQVDFLEGHEEYSMCFHKVSVVYEGEIKQEQLFERLQEGDYSAYDIYADWMVPTCTVVYRNSPVPFESNSRIVFGDIFLWLQLAERGKIYCLDFVGGTYRRHEKGVSFNYFGETNARLFRQYEFMEKRFPELQLVSKMKKDNCLEKTAFSPYFPSIWRYRILYLFRHPKRFFVRLLPFLLWKT